MSKPGTLEEVRIVLTEHIGNTLEKQNILTLLTKLFMGFQISLKKYLHLSTSIKNFMKPSSAIFGPYKLCIFRDTLK